MTADTIVTLSVLGLVLISLLGIIARKPIAVRETVNVRVKHR
jgi:hypothetical protein